MPPLMWLRLDNFIRIEKFSKYLLANIMMRLMHVGYTLQLYNLTNLSLAGLYVFGGKSFYSSGYCCQVKNS